MAALSLCLSGCGGGDSRPGNAAVDSPQSQPAQSTLDKSAATPSLPARPELIVPSATPAAPQIATLSSIEQPPVLQSPESALAPDPQDVARAKVLFQKLMEPGLKMEEWDQVQSRFVDLGAAAVSVLTEQLQEENSLVREQATTLFVLLGPQAEPVADELLEALEDPSYFVRVNAAATLVQMPRYAQQAVPVLIRLLESPDPQLRQMAAMNLGALGEEAVAHVDSLSRALGSEQDEEVIIPVVDLLGRIGPLAEPALPTLKRIVYEKPGEAAEAARTAIQRIATGQSAKRPTFAD